MAKNAGIDDAHTQLILNAIYPIVCFIVRRIYYLSSASNPLTSFPRPLLPVLA